MKTTKHRTKHLWVAVAAGAVGLTSAASAEEITVATVNNGDMIIMQELSAQWEEETGNTVNWVVLEENVLRQRVTTDIATQGGQFDVLTIGSYEAPIWGAQEWLVTLDDLGDDYDYDDLIPAVKAGLSHDGSLYAVPFYAESSFTMYRTDLFEEAGLEMPEEPSWEFVADAARQLTDKDAEQYGICLRGKPGWGENGAFLGAMANSFGARWFDMDWNPQFDSEEWANTLNFYVDLMTDAGPPGASANGFNENLALFQTGKCAMWIDATSAGSGVTSSDSEVADRVGFALAPDNGLGKRANWLWAWALAIPAGTDNEEAAKKFVAWATSKEYLELVAENEGWSQVPPGSRTSLYENENYLEVPFAEMTLASINAADPTQPTVDEVPYVGVQFVAIPEFQGIGNDVGQEFSAALAGTKTVEEALEAAQALTKRQMDRAGYPK